MTTLLRRNNYFNISPFGEIDKFFGVPSRRPDAPAAMKTDIFEDDKNYTLEIEVAGYKKEEIDIKLEHGYLKVTAKKAKNEGENKPTYVKRERFVGAITRSYYLGEALEVSDITAKYENGILSLSFPKEVKDRDSAVNITIPIN